jgi:tetratricopeptide (TPR) repeat protein
MSFARPSLVVWPCLYLASLGVTAQTKGVDEAYFKREPKLVALDSVQKAMTLKGGKSRVMAQVGRAYLVLGDRAKAEALFAQVDPRDSESARWMVKGWLEVGEAARAEMAEAQMPIYGSLLREEMLNVSVLLMQQGRMEAAESRMGALLANDKSDWDRAARFGAECLQSKHPEWAARWFKKALTINAGKAEVWATIAVAYAENIQSLPLGQGAVVGGTKADAISFLEDPKSLVNHCASEAKRLGSRKAMVLASAGTAWFGIGERVKAEQAFTSALENYFNEPRVLFSMAKARMSYGTREEGLEAYKQLAEVNLSRSFNNLKNILEWIAADLVQRGLVEEATAYMLRSYELDHEDASNFVDFGRAALLAGQTDLAATYFSRATQADPNDVDVWLDIASAELAFLRKSAPVTP